MRQPRSIVNLTFFREVRASQREKLISACVILVCMLDWEVNFGIFVAHERGVVADVGEELEGQNLSADLRI